MKPSLAITERMALRNESVGRVDVKDKWEETENQWYNTYRNRLTIPGLSVCKTVTPQMEWCAEAYMETDYSTLTQVDFEFAVKQYIAYKFLSNEETI